MISLLLVGALGQYTNEPSIGFARGVAIALPLPVTKKSKFKVSIFNGTKIPITIPGENCNWGYRVVSFELVSPAGGSYAITRKQISWRGGSLVPVVIPSLGNEIRIIDFSDGTWQGFNPGIAGSTDGWKIKVKLNVAESKLLRENGFWIGKIESEFTPAKMTD